VLEMPDNAVWTKADEVALIDYLQDLEPTAGDGGNFRVFVWTGASEKLSPLIMKGGPKTPGSCKYKWGNVCVFLLYLHWLIDNHHS